MIASIMRVRLRVGRDGTRLEARGATLRLADVLAAEHRRGHVDDLLRPRGLHVGKVEAELLARGLEPLRLEERVRVVEARERHAHQGRRVVGAAGVELGLELEKSLSAAMVWSPSCFWRWYRAMPTPYAASIVVGLRCSAPLAAPLEERLKHPQGVLVAVLDEVGERAVDGGRQLLERGLALAGEALLVEVDRREEPRRVDVFLRLDRLLRPEELLAHRPVGGLLVGGALERRFASAARPRPRRAWPLRRSTLTRSVSSGLHSIACSHSRAARACSPPLSAQSAALE